MTDTMPKAERLDLAAKIQGTLSDPAATGVGIFLDRAEATRLVETLRGHDLLKLSDAIYQAFDTSNGELGSLVSDVFDRMTSDEYDEIVEAIADAVSGPEEQHGFSVTLDDLLRGFQVLEQYRQSYPAAIAKWLELPEIAAKYAGEVEKSPWLLESLGAASGIEAEPPATRPVTQRITLAFKMGPNGFTRVSDDDFYEQFGVSPEEYVARRLSDAP